MADGYATIVIKLFKIGDRIRSPGRLILCWCGRRSMSWWGRCYLVWGARVLLTLDWIVASSLAFYMCFSSATSRRRAHWKQVSLLLSCGDRDVGFVSTQLGASSERECKPQRHQALRLDPNWLIFNYYIVWVWSLIRFTFPAIHFPCNSLFQVSCI